MPTESNNRTLETETVAVKLDIATVQRSHVFSSFELGILTMAIGRQDITYHNRQLKLLDYLQGRTMFTFLR